MLANRIPLRGPKAIVREHSAAEITEKPEDKNSPNGSYRVLYDGQCEVLRQACVSWLKVLDHEGKTVCLPVSADVLSSVDSRLVLGGMPTKTSRRHSRTQNRCRLETLSRVWLACSRS